MQIFVRAEDTVLVEADTVAQLQNAIASRCGVDVSEQILSYGGKPLEGVGSLSDFGLQDNATVDLTGRLLGGKVHGSLARAGKVRGQTPKVEPQEKKKQKTGRAKRRRQYGRRFKNVVAQGPGRRRGPNSNMGK